MDNEVVISVRSDNDTKSGFDSARRDAKGLGDDLGKIGSGAGKKMGDGISLGVFDGIKGVGTGIQPALTPVLAGAAVPGSAILGATISAAIIGAAGIGAAGIGVALVSKRDDVAAAGKALGDSVMSGLSSKADVFVKPVMHAIDEIEGSFNKVGGNLDSIFSNASRFVGPLVDGVTHFAEKVVEGVDSLVATGGPVIDVISEGIAGIGDEIGDMFNDLGDNGVDAASALRGAFGGVMVVIDAVATTVNALTEAYGFLVKVGAFGQDAAVQYAVLQANADIAAGSQRDLGAATDDLSNSMQSEIDKLDELHESQLASLDPAYGLLQAQQDITKAQEDYNKALDEHGEKSPEAEEALRRVAQAASKAGAAAVEAGEGFDGTMSPAMEAIYRNAGLSEGQISALKTQLRQAAAAARGWEGTFTQTYVTNYESYGLKSPSAMGGFQGLATGGIKGAASGMNTNGLTWVGEQGPELVNIPAGSTVHSSADSQRMMKSGGGGGGGGGEFILSAKPGASRGLIEVLVESLQYECRTRYEGLAQNMFGVN